MRTTLAIDDGILAVAREIAKRERRSLGAVISELARKGLTEVEQVPKMRNGIPVLPKRGVVVTMEMVNALRDEEE